MSRPIFPTVPFKMQLAPFATPAIADSILGMNSGGNAGGFTPGNPYYIPTGMENIPPESSFDASKRGILADKASRFAGKLAKPREPWKGASGRTTLVDPVRDTPQAQRIKIPPRNPNRPSPGNTPTQGETHTVSDSFGHLLCDLHVIALCRTHATPAVRR